MACLIIFDIQMAFVLFILSQLHGFQGFSLLEEVQRLSKSVLYLSGVFQLVFQAHLLEFLYTDVAIFDDAIFWALFYHSPHAFDVLPVLMRPQCLISVPIFRVNFIPSFTPLQLYKSLYLINEFIHLSFRQFWNIPLGRKGRERPNNDLAITHQIDDLRIIIPISLPSRVGDNMIQFRHPQINSDGNTLLCTSKES